MLRLRKLFIECKGDQGITLSPGIFSEQSVDSLNLPAASLLEDTTSIQAPHRKDTNLTQASARRSSKFVQSLRDFHVSIVDAQLLFGLALFIATTRLRCKMDLYHFDVVLYMFIVIAATCLISINTIVRLLHDDPTAKAAHIYRLVLLLVVFMLCSVYPWGSDAFLPDQPKPSSAYMAFKAVCFLGKGTRKFSDDNPFTMIVALSCGLLFTVALAFVDRIFAKCSGTMWKLLRVFLPVCEFGYFLTIVYFASRRIIGIQKSAQEYINGGSEQDLTFGQIVPIVLLGLPVHTLIESLLFGLTNRLTNVSHRGSNAGQSDSDLEMSDI